MLIANTADWHLRGKDLDACNEQLATLVMECVNREVDLLCIAGDVFERSTIGDNHASTGAIAAVAIHAVKELTKHGISVIMLVGNHDQSGAGSADALHIFDRMENVMIIRNPQFVDVGPLTFYALPWSWYGNNAEDYLKGQLLDAPTPRISLFLAHIQVIGSRMSGSFTCDPKPGAWQVSRAFLENLPVDHFALGDFHARQELVAGKGGYVGALRQCNFGEGGNVRLTGMPYDGNPAGFEIWDSERNTTEWVELGAAPKHITLKADGVDTKPLVESSGKWLTRIQYEDMTPDPAEIARLESLGVVIEQILDRPERIARAAVPEGAINNPHALIDLWAGVQNPPIEQERLAELHAGHDRLFADAVAVSISSTISTESGALPF
jgi:hypothetical protein